MLPVRGVTYVPVRTPVSINLIARIKMGATACVTRWCHHPPSMARRARQLELGLEPVFHWGGRRTGAGRKPGPSPRDPHRARPPLASRFPCHVTLKTRRGLPSLRDVRFVREFERSLRAACERGRFRVAHYAIQPDHVHVIVEASGRDDLAAGMKSIGSRLARAVNRVFRRRGPVLADRYHLHILRTPREVRNAIAYVLLNARRHLAKRRRALATSPRVDHIQGKIALGMAPIP